MTMIAPSQGPVVSSNFGLTSGVAAVNQNMADLKAGKSTMSIQFLMMSLSVEWIGATTDQLTVQVEKSTNNLNKLTAMNQLKADTSNLTAVRNNAGKKDADTMTSNSTDTTNFYNKAAKAGIEFSKAEAENWKTGKVTAADITTIEARIKTQQDSVTNMSTADNMQMQKFNTMITQFTNMGMSFLDEIKRAVQKIFG